MVAPLRGMISRLPTVLARIVAGLSPVVGCMISRLPTVLAVIVWDIDIAGCRMTGATISPAATDSTRTAAFASAPCRQGTAEFAGIDPATFATPRHGGDYAVRSATRRPHARRALTTWC